MSRVFEAMSAHYHEHYDAMLIWSWKLFCRRWGQMIIDQHRREQDQEEQRRQQAFAELSAEHKKNWG